MDEDVKVIFVAGLIGLVGLIFLAWLTATTEPKCPPGSQSHYSRGWFCVVSPLEK